MSGLTDMLAEPEIYETEYTSTYSVTVQVDIFATDECNRAAAHRSTLKHSIRLTLPTLYIKLLAGFSHTTIGR